MTTKPISREYRIYLAIWRKAFKERLSDRPEVTINASNRNLAIAMRQGMYRAIRPFRNGIMFDEELRQASELFVVFLTRNEDAGAPTTLILRPRITLNELERDLVNLDLDEEDLLLTEERMAQESLSDILPDHAPARSTPFYNR
jgi:hypothetical protein